MAKQPLKAAALAKPISLSSSFKFVCCSQMIRNVGRNYEQLENRPFYMISYI